MAYVRTVFLFFILLATGLTNSTYAAAPIPVAVPVAAPAEEAPVTGGAAVIDPDHKLGPGDIVTLEIVEDKGVPTRTRVTDTGDLDVPYISRVHVAGKSSSDAAAQISRALEKFYVGRPTVKLSIDQINVVKLGPVGTVYLSGQIKSQGPQAIPPGAALTVSGAVLKAGGFTQFADSRKVKLTRKNKGAGGAKVFIIDVKAVLDGDVDKDIELMDGDYINVPQRIISFTNPSS